MKRFGLLTFLILGVVLIGCSDDDATVDCADNDGDGVMAGADCEGDVDCDDADDTVWQELDGYPDGDGDGVYSDTAETVCSGESLPSEYSDMAGDDCDDMDDTAWMQYEAYVDEDMDGTGVGELVDVCGGDTLPDGYSDVTGDCDDASDMVSVAMDGWLDYDMDTVPSDASMVLCTDGTLPMGFSDVAGTDCDDFDPYVQTDDATTHAACMLQGTCVDTEGAGGAPDMMGVGACVSIDCNGADPTCAEPMHDQQVSCVDANDCNSGEVCMDWTGGTNLSCWAIPNCCNSDPTGYTCSEIVDCLEVCKATYYPQDLTSYAACLQMDCIEGARPSAQQLYRIAQECAAPAGCFAAQDMTGCAMANCQMEFGVCVLDTP